jgi:hypothetical protein
LNYLAIGQKNKIFLFLFSQPLTDFAGKKNPDFRIKRACLCFIGEAKGREHKRSRPTMEQEPK